MHMPELPRVAWVAAFLVLALGFAYYLQVGPQTPDTFYGASPTATVSPGSSGIGHRELFDAGGLKASESVSVNGDRVHVLSLSSERDQEVSVFAVVSKDLAASASELNLENGFTVVHDDPVVLKILSLKEKQVALTSLSFVSSREGPVVWFVLKPEWNRAPPKSRAKLNRLLGELAGGDLVFLKTLEKQFNELLNDGSRSLDARLAEFEKLTATIRVTPSPPPTPRPGAAGRDGPPDSIVMEVSAFAPYSVSNFFYPAPAESVLFKLESGSRFIELKAFPVSVDRSKIVVSVDARNLSTKLPEELFDLNLFFTSLQISSTFKPDVSHKIPLSVIVLKQPFSSNVMVYRFPLNDPGRHYVFNAMPFSTVVDGVSLPPQALTVSPKKSEALSGLSVRAPVLDSEEAVQALAVSQAESLHQRISVLPGSQRSFAFQGQVLFVDARPVWMDVSVDADAVAAGFKESFSKQDVAASVSLKKIGDKVFVSQVSMRLVSEQRG